ncbi:MAG: hypothetical protein OEO20_09450 [Gemmatimonadota bacterium]|nr:hypothetical protein [Gemmatimonadota bacterium]MDH3367077.1 hypothetical protein [Gemmatimonadota bacterium]MDH3478517.1 hypothetical protein [Gemmatimonadota bacterium]MDH3570739.1 hypothetical protein [Gemmatimonadota bacterium]
MISSTTRLPLRIPELGPYLGKLVTGTGRAPGGLRLDAVRIRLVTRVFERVGEAKRLAAREQRQQAVGAIGRTAWLEAWEEAVAGAADLLVARASRRIQAEAEAVRIPRRGRRRLAPSAADRRAVGARLGSAGAALVPALDAVERSGSAALTAPGSDPAALTGWQEALTTAGRRLEAAWLALEEAIEVESAQWERVASDVARWRRSLWPVAVVGLVALAGATWFGLVLGGYVPPPDWLATLWQQVFRG